MSPGRNSTMTTPSTPDLTRNTNRNDRTTGASRNNHCSRNSPASRAQSPWKVVGRNEVPSVPNSSELTKAPTISTTSAPMATMTLPDMTATRFGCTTSTVFHMFWDFSSPMSSAASSTMATMYSVGLTNEGASNDSVASPNGENSACRSWSMAPTSFANDSLRLVCKIRPMISASTGSSSQYRAAST